MNFLNPAMLGGLAALSVPVIIHFLNRFRVKNTDWGAMRFLLESVRQNERRVKLQDLLLLILRLLLVALAVFAFARPVMKGPASAGGSTGPVAAVVLLDSSGSMSRSIGPEIAFDKAKRMINTWLDGLDSQSVAGLYLVSNRPEPLIPQPGPDFGLFRNMLAEAQPGDRASDLLPALKQAVESLRNVTGRPREIHVYTDGQAAAWRQSAEIMKLVEEHPEIRFIPMLVEGGVTANLGITSLVPEDGSVAVGQPAVFLVDVANHGDEPAEQVQVSLTTGDGSPAGDAVIDRIETGATGRARLTVSFNRPGPASLTASITPDSFATDNRRALALEVTGQTGILIGEENPDSPALDRDGFYLANALLPLSREKLAQHFMAIHYARPSALADELSTANLADRIVFLCNPSLPTSAAATALGDYVRRGGNLVIFPGEFTDPVGWKANESLNALMPADLGAPTEEEEGSPGLAWQGSGFSHPVTELWNDPAQGRLSAIRAFRHFPLTPRKDTRVIAAFSDGQPVAVEGRYGEGSVVVFATPVTPAWTNLPLHPAFVPLVQRLMTHLNRKGDSRLALTPGEVFRKTVPSEFGGEEYSILRPDSDAPRPAGRVITGDGDAYVRYALTDRAGLYTISSGREVLATFAVQMDPSEFDLHAVDPALPAQMREVRQNPQDSSQWVVTREFWTPLVWAVAVFFIGEAFLAHRFSKLRAA